MNLSLAPLRKSLAPLTATLLCLAAAIPSLAAEDADAPKGAAVTVLKAAKSCFDRIVEVSVRDRDPAGGDFRAAGPAGAEGRGDHGRCRR